MRTATAILLVFCLAGCRDTHEEALTKACEILASGPTEARSSTDNAPMVTNVRYEWALDASGTGFAAEGTFNFTTSSVHYFLVTAGAKVGLANGSSKDELGRQCSGRMDGFGWRLSGSNTVVTLSSDQASVKVLVVENEGTRRGGGGFDD